MTADGRLGEATVVMKHNGSSVNPKRQRGPRAHAAVLSADNRFVFAPDLGLDQILSYRLDPVKASLSPKDPPFAKVAAGAGPRHFAFHPKGKYATGAYLFAANQNSDNIVQFRVDPKSGRLKPTGKTVDVSKPVCVQFTPAQ